MFEWSKETPAKSGVYWFYGRIDGKQTKYPVIVELIYEKIYSEKYNPIMYLTVMCNSRLRQAVKDQYSGYFMEVEIPNKEEIIDEQLD